MSNSNFSGRTSRTMNEAFGPYCNTEIHEVSPPPCLFTKGDIAVMVVCMAALIFLKWSGIL